MWIIPVDLAEAGDWTAVAAVDVTEAQPRVHRVRHLDRWHAKYTETVGRVVTLANTPPLTDALLAVDATGVGRPVVETIRAALPGRVVYGVTITGGARVTPGAGPRDIRVPKNDLVGVAQVLLQTGRLLIARELAHADTLVKELAGFVPRITPALHVTYEAGREGLNDDLVLALAMAAWLGEHLPGPAPDAREIVLNLLPGDTPKPERVPSRLDQLAAEFPELLSG